MASTFPIEYIIANFSGFPTNIPANAPKDKISRKMPVI
jgi:hypothetical protein